MDDKRVSEVDLGSGLLLREEDGDVGKLVCLRLFRVLSYWDREEKRNNGLMILR